MGTEGQGQPTQSNSPEERDAWGLDENGCHPSCPIRILGEQSGECNSHSMGPKYEKAYQEGMTGPHIGNVYGDYKHKGKPGVVDQGTAARYFAQFYPDSSEDGGLDENGCAPDCPIRILGEQSGERPSGGRVDKNGDTWSVWQTTTSRRAKDAVYERDTGKADRFFKVFPPDSLFAGMEEEER